MERKRHHTKHCLNSEVAAQIRPTGCSLPNQTTIESLLNYNHWNVMEEESPGEWTDIMVTIEKPTRIAFSNSLGYIRRNTGIETLGELRTLLIQNVKVRNVKDHTMAFFKSIFIETEEYV